MYAYEIFLRLKVKFITYRVQFINVLENALFPWLIDRRRTIRSSFNDSGIWEINVGLASAINFFL